MPRSYVTDQAGIIDPEARQFLLGRLQELEQKTGVQMLILTVETTDGVPIEEFALAKAEAWKLGQKGKDNGLLFVVAFRDRKYRVEVGYGLESIIPDSMAGSIARQYLVPAFKRGAYGQGIAQSTTALTDIIAKSQGVALSTSPYPAQSKRRSTSRNSLPGGLIVFLLIFFVASFFQKALSGRRTWSRGSRRYYGAGFPMGGAGGGFGGFGGGGFGSFGGGGGGGFGGGGASGGW